MTPAPTLCSDCAGREGTDHDCAGADDRCSCPCRQPKTRALTIRLTEEEYRALTAKANTECRTIAQEVRKAVRDAVLSAPLSTVPHQSAPIRTTEHRSAPLSTNGNHAAPLSIPAVPSRVGAALEFSSPTEQQPQDQLLSSLASDFEEFWAAYPRHHDNNQPGGGGPKAEARKRWAKLKAAERVAAVVGVRHYAADCSARRAFVASAVTWLNQRRWEDWQEAALPSLNGARAPNGHEPCTSDDIADWIDPDILARQRAAGTTP